MKAIEFCGKTFRDIPDWVEFIAQDEDGTIAVFEVHPKLREGVWRNEYDTMWEYVDAPILARCERIWK